MVQNYINFYYYLYYQYLLHMNNKNRYFLYLIIVEKCKMNNRVKIYAKFLILSLLQNKKVLIF